MSTEINSTVRPEKGTTTDTELETGASGAKTQSNLTDLTDTDGGLSSFKALSFLDRYLAVWIFLAMAVGILLGEFVKQTGPALQKGKFVGVSVPIAVGLLVMMYPILCKVRFEELHKSLKGKEIWKQFAFSIVVNWIIAPFFMTALAFAFLPDQANLRQGLILTGSARCIAMVLIWVALAKGHNEYCAMLVALNSVLQLVLFAPLATLLIGVVSDPDGQKTITYSAAAKSVAVFLGIPLGAAIVTRFTVRKLIGAQYYDGVFLRVLSPLSLIGLLFTIIVLFGSQGERVVHQIVDVVRVAAPLIVYFAVIFMGTLFTCYRLGFSYPLSVSQSFTASSNNFELAIAVAVGIWGVDSDQALAATVGPLIEVPVLLGLVYLVGWLRKRTRRWK